MKDWMKILMFVKTQKLLTFFADKGSKNLNKIRVAANT